MYLKIYSHYFFFFKQDLPVSSEIHAMQNTITSLKRSNDLLKQQILSDQVKENLRLEMLTDHIFKQLEERENASRLCQQKIELESLYQEEILLLKEQVSILESDYKALQTSFKEVNSIIESNESNIGNEVSDFNLDKFYNLILLYSQKLSLVEIEPSEGCFTSTFLDSPFCFETLISNISENLNTVKNYIFEKCITFRFDEFIDTLKDRILMIVSNLSQFLKEVKNYILEKDIKSRFVEYIDILNGGISSSYELLQKSSMCLEQEEIKNSRKRKINRIRATIDNLLVELNELDIDINTSN